MGAPHMLLRSRTAALQPDRFVFRRLARRPRALLLAAALACAALCGARPAEAVVVERIVAIVGDKPIFLSELRARARPFLLQIQQKVPAGAQQHAAESSMFKELIEKMIDEELEAQAAEKARITVTSDEIDNALRNSATAQQTTVAALYKEARAKGLTDQDFRDEIRRQVLEGKLLLLRVKGRVRITEEDIRSMYERVSREERKRREYRPAWIVLRVLPGASDAAVQERQALALSIAERARAGEDFAALAQQYSDDTATRDLGGDLGIRAPAGSQGAVAGRRPTLAPELEAALMPLEAGAVTAPVRAGDAIVIMKLLSRQPSRYTGIEQARNEMVQRLQVEILEKAKRKWLDELKRRTHLDVRL
jgi:peptidyl-prolyl cis-trans isomerase SurA